MADRVWTERHIRELVRRYAGGGDSPAGSWAIRKPIMVAEAFGPSSPAKGHLELAFDIGEKTLTGARAVQWNNTPSAWYDETNYPFNVLTVEERTIDYTGRVAPVKIISAKKFNSTNTYGGDIVIPVPRNMDGYGEAFFVPEGETADSKQIGIWGYAWKYYSDIYPIKVVDQSKPILVWDKENDPNANYIDDIIMYDVDPIHFGEELPATEIRPYVFIRSVDGDIRVSTYVIEPGHPILEPPIHDFVTGIPVSEFETGYNKYGLIDEDVVIPSELRYGGVIAKNMPNGDRFSDRNYFLNAVDYGLERIQLFTGGYGWNHSAISGFKTIRILFKPRATLVNPSRIDLNTLKLYLLTDNIPSGLTHSNIWS